MTLPRCLCPTFWCSRCAWPMLFRELFFCEPLANSINAVLIFNTVVPNGGGKRLFHFSNAPFSSSSFIFLSAICRPESSPTLTLFLGFLLGTSCSSSLSKSKSLVQVSSRRPSIFRIDVPLAEQAHLYRP